ncbi:MAG: hypothetical protein IT492_18520 [Gammaproteobacteria bacterium]|nr:hypothetical protein [Gammaproteobacteria bacterium]
MTATNIISALLLVALIVLLLPRARQMVNESPAAQPGDWQGFILPLIAVALFVLLLMKMV